MAKALALLTVALLIGAVIGLCVSYLLGYLPVPVVRVPVPETPAPFATSQTFEERDPWMKWVDSGLDIDIRGNTFESVDCFVTPRPSACLEPVHQIGQ
jgi:hypothetical protein